MSDIVAKAGLLAGRALRAARDFSAPRWLSTSMTLANNLAEALPNKNSTILQRGASSKMDELCARHRRYRAADVPRSYMLYGPPGTGKSSFAAALADRLGEKTLKLDATSLAHASVSDMQFLLDNLLPDFVIIDDVDKAAVGSAIPTLLDVLARFKTEGATASAILTANGVADFDKGLLRPGRVDTWVEFKLPDDSERAAVLRRYCDDLGVDAAPLVIGRLAKESAGLSQDYLREIALSLRHGEAGEVAEQIRAMKALLAEPVPAAAPTGKAVAS